MDAVFYLAGAVAVIATLLMLISSKPVHALLNLVVSLLAVAVVFYTLGAPFAAALEAIVYAGAIMVLFVFMVMLLNPQDAPPVIRVADWAGPAILAAVLIVELLYILVRGPGTPLAGGPVEPKQVGIALFGPYLIGVELASVLLLAGLVGAFHLGGRDSAQPTKLKDEPHVVRTHERRADSGSDLVLAGTDRPSRTP
jgi:NADH-quinone oxidoreductase subunit J